MLLFSCDLPLRKVGRPVAAHGESVAHRTPQPLSSPLFPSPRLGPQCTRCLSQELYLRRIQSVLGSRASAARGCRRIAVNFAVAGQLEEFRQASEAPLSRLSAHLRFLSPSYGFRDMPAVSLLLEGSWRSSGGRVQLRFVCTPALVLLGHQSSSCLQVEEPSAAPLLRACSSDVIRDCLREVPACLPVRAQVEEWAEKPIEGMPVHVSDIFAGA